MPPPPVVHVGTVILGKGFDNVNYFGYGTGEQGLIGLGLNFAPKKFRKKRKGIQMIRFGAHLSRTRLSRTQF